MDNRSKQDRQRADLMGLTVSELDRLRKIEAAARALTVDFNGDVLAFCTELSKLRSSVETEADG